MARSAENCTVSVKQARFVAALLAHPTIAAAAKDCKISERTAYYWLEKPAVQLAYRQARLQAYDSAIARIQGLCQHAVTALGKNLLNDTGASAGVRAVQLRAAELILDHARHASEIASLQDQIDELKRLLGEEIPRGRAPTTLTRVK